jgi:hypothetical protein
MAGVLSRWMAIQVPSSYRWRGSGSAARAGCRAVSAASSPVCGLASMVSPARWDPTIQGIRVASVVTPWSVAAVSQSRA